MTNPLAPFLLRFTPENAEQIYGEIYRYCASSQFCVADAEASLAPLLEWTRDASEPVLQSYGILTLGALIDSSKLTSGHGSTKIVEFFAESASQIDRFDVLDANNHFVHFVSHYAYLAASIVQQIGKEQGVASKIVSEMLRLYLRAPTPYFCGEELLVGRLLLEADLGEGPFRQMMAELEPNAVMQEADMWDAEAAARWKALQVAESHKRQLVLALYAICSQLGVGVSPLVTRLVEAIYVRMFVAQ